VTTGYRDGVRGHGTIVWPGTSSQAQRIRILQPSQTLSHSRTIQMVAPAHPTRSEGPAPLDDAELVEAIVQGMGKMMMHVRMDDTGRWRLLKGKRALRKR
jgi:hypothetical protein